MKRLVFIVEGDTEVCFIQKFLIPYFYRKGLTNPMHAQKIVTNRKMNKRGGNVSFEYLKNDVMRVAASGNVLITTLLDFFRLPTDFPNFTLDSRRISEIEGAMKQELQDVVSPSCFLPYIQRHEMETLMFTNMDGFEIVVDNEEQLVQLQSIINEYPNPEDIDGGPETAPSKRLINIFPYSKTTDGEMILEMLDIDDIRKKCPRFNQWIELLEVGLKEDEFS